MFCLFTCLFAKSLLTSYFLLSTVRHCGDRAAAKIYGVFVQIKKKKCLIHKALCFLLLEDYCNILTFKKQDIELPMLENSHTKYINLFSGPKVEHISKPKY